MYDTRNGIAPVRAFNSSTRPVHVGYTTALGCFSQPLDTADQVGALAAAGILIEGGSGVVCAHGVGMLLKTATVRGFSSVIVVVDTKQMRGVTLGQLAAYVALTGLAEADLSASDPDDPAAVPGPGPSAAGPDRMGPRSSLRPVQHAPGKHAAGYGDQWRRVEGD